MRAKIALLFNKRGENTKKKTLHFAIVTYNKLNANLVM